MSAVISLTQEELQKLIEKETRKAVMQAVGSGSVKGKVRELPKLDIGASGKLEAAMEAAGHQLSTVMVSGYQPVTKNEKTDKNWGGYAFITSPEKLGFKQKAEFFITTTGVSGMIDLDGVTDALNKIRAIIVNKQAALDGLRDYEKGFEAIFNQMTENEVKN